MIRPQRPHQESEKSPLRSTTAACHRQSGFTLLELMAVISIVALMVSFGTFKLIEYSERKVVDQVVNDILTLSYAAGAYASNHRGKWPDDNNDGVCDDALQKLLNDGYLGGDFVSPWSGASYTFDCPSDISFTISLDVPTREASLFAYKIPSTAVTPATGGNSTITHYLPLPRYKTGIVVNQTFDAALSASTPSTNGKLWVSKPTDCSNPSISVQPLTICETVVDQNLIDLPPSTTGIRGYRTDIDDSSSAGWLISLESKNAANNFDPVYSCEKSVLNVPQPIKFSVMVYCQ